MVMIHSFDHAALNVSDLEASKKFYGERLGFKEIARPEFDFNGVWYGLGDIELHLLEQPDLRPADKRMHHHFALRVQDVEKTKAELAEAGVEIVLSNARPDGVDQIFVADPDGYIIEFSNT